MEIVIAGSYEELSEKAAEDLAALTKTEKNPLICTASGDSPAGLYKSLVEKFNKKELEIPGWSFLGLDEWAGMNGSDEGSCRYHLNNQLFRPLNVDEKHICFFDGRAESLEKECAGTENFIRRHNGITVAILGLGMNGHIGMNEPGTAASLRSHVTDLDPLTIQTAQKYFQRKQELSKGITLGLATLLEAKHIQLLVSGKHKAGIVKKMMEEEISENLPATLFREHRGLTIYLDKEAASLL